MSLPDGLPVAPLFRMHLRRTWRFTPWWAKFRLANQMMVWVGPFQIAWRMPWLRRSALALHPELFGTQLPESGTQLPSEGASA